MAYYAVPLIENADMPRDFDLPPALEDLGRECGEVLDLAVRGLFQAGTVKTTNDALAHLAAVVEEDRSRSRRELLTNTSLRGSTHTHALLELQLLLDPETERGGYLERRIGSFLHMVVTMLRTKQLPNYGLLNQPQPAFTARGAVQLPLIPHGTKKAVQGHLFWMDLPYKDQICSDGTIRQEHVQHIEALWMELKRYLRLTKEWWRNYVQFPPNTVAELEAALAPILYPYLDDMRRHRTSPRHEYLYTLMLLIVTTVVLEVAEDTTPHVFAYNVRPVPWVHGVHGGFIDLVDIRLPESNRGDVRMLRTVQLYASQFRGTFLELVHNCKQMMPEATLTIDEMKFMVGDGLSHTALLYPTFDQPPQRHQRQLSRYRALPALDAALRTRVRTANGLLKRAMQHVPDGYLEYFAPDMPEIFPSTTKATEIEYVIEREYAMYLDRAAHATEIRRTSNVVLREAIRLVQRKPVRIRPVTVPQDALFQPRRPALIRVIHQIKYADEHGIVRRERAGDQRKLVMDVGRLLKAIEDGTIEAPGFDLASNSVLPCFLTGHRTRAQEHEQATLTINLTAQRPFFYCRGGLCGRTGTIDRMSVPNDLRHLLVPARLHRGAGNGFEAWTIPAEHYRCMHLAHEYMQRAFENSAALSYLEHRRKISGDVARAYGIGYADRGLVPYLIDTFRALGMSNEAALNATWKHGFLGYSERKNHDFLDRLRQMGFADHQLQRPRTDDDEIVIEFPYPALTNHITFPLTMGDERILNFQGRVVGDEEDLPRKQVKLSTGGPQGGFNLQLLSQLAARNEPVYVAESSLDALSLIAMGYPAVGISGTAPGILLDLIASANVPVAMAFDHDKPGAQSAQRWIKALYGRNPNGQFINWTEVVWDTLPSHARLRPNKRGKRGRLSKDYNELIKRGLGVHGAAMNSFSLRVCPFSPPDFPKPRRH